MGVRGWGGGCGVGSKGLRFAAPFRVFLLLGVVMLVEFLLLGISFGFCRTWS